jgi:hypothetical protein
MAKKPSVSDLNQIKKLIQILGQPIKLKNLGISIINNRKKLKVGLSLSLMIDILYESQKGSPSSGIEVGTNLTGEAADRAREIANGTGASQ